MLQFVPLGSEENAPETQLQFVPLGSETSDRRVSPEVQAERDQESIAYLEAERQRNLEAGDTEAAEANAREIARRQKTAAPAVQLQFVPLSKEKPKKVDYSKQQQVNEPVDYTAAATSMEGTPSEASAQKQKEIYAAPTERGSGFMLRPEFVEEVRSSFSGLPPEKRRAALEQAAAGTGVRAQAAQRILEQVKAEDERRRIDSIGQERMIKLLAEAEKKPKFGQIGTGAPAQFPDVAPTIAEEADRLRVSEQERIRRRLAKDEAERAIAASAATPEAVVEREMDRQRGESQFFSELGRGAMRAITSDLPSMWEQAGLTKDVGAAATLNQRLDLFDRIDRGEITSPDQLRGLDISNSQARAYLSSPENREKMRARIVDQIADRKDLVNTAIKTIEQYQLDAQQYRPLVDRPRNIGSTEDFVNWLGSTIGSGAVQTAPLLLAAAATGGVGLITGSAIMGTAEAVGERLKYIQDKTKDLPKEQKTDAIIEYLQKTGDTTLLAGIVSGALDAVLGPEARMLKLRAKEIAREATRMQAFKREVKEVPRQLGEEGFTGALQQAVQIAAGVQLKEKPEFWTKENLVDITEAGLTEAAGSLGPVGVTTAIGTARTPAAARREVPPALPAAPPKAPPATSERIEPTLEGELPPVEEPRTEPRARTAPSTMLEQQRAVEEMEAAIEGEQVGTQAPEAVQAEAQREEEPAAAVVQPIVQNASIGPGHPDYESDVLAPARQAVANNNALPVKLKDGTNINLVVSRNEDDSEGRVIAFDKEGNEVGQVTFAKVEAEDGTRYNPNVYVDEKLRRQGLATAMYNLAESSGAKIPSVNQEGQVRSPEGEAFRRARKEPAAAVAEEEVAVKPAAEVEKSAVQEEAKPALVDELAAVQTEIPRQAVVEVPLTKLKLSEDVPQFKAGADRAGIVEPLGGKFERTGVAPIQVWRRANGDMEVISGRHRFDLAKRSGETTIPAQIHDESRGFTRDMAAVLDAELNIRDGQGKVKDYVNYFKGTGLDQDTAESRGLLARAPGKRAFTIATKGSDELVTNLRADQIPDEAAYLIALNAPNDARLQGVGIKAIQEGKSATTAVNMMQAVRALAGEADTTTDMFGFDDSAMKEAEEMAKIAGRKQKEIQTRLNAITGAAKNPAVARAEGIDIRDPQAVSNRISQLRQMKSAWDNWSTNPDLIAEIRDERGVEAPVLKPYTAEEAVSKTEREEAVRREEEAKPAEAPSADEFVLTGSKRAADEAAARGQMELGAPTEAEQAREALKESAANLFDVIAEATGARKNITGQQYTVKDIPPALTKVMKALVDLGYVNFKDMVRELMTRMRASDAWKDLADDVTPKMLRQAYNRLPKFEGKETPAAINRVTDDDLSMLMTPPKQLSVGKNVYGMKPLAQWSTPSDTKLDGRLIYNFVDKNVDMKRVIQSIERNVGEIEDQWNPYLKEEAYHGRTARGLKDFLMNDVSPLAKAMNKEGVTIDELYLYLHSRFAPIRNRNIAKINPDEYPDGGSGIFTDDAERYMNSLTPEQKAKYERIAKLVDRITQGTRDLLVASGLETQETINSWEESSPFYVPLNRGDVEYSPTAGRGIGQGYSVKGPFSRRATGSLRNVADIIANVIAQRERALAKSEAMRVGVALYGLAIQNPNPEFWLAVNPDSKKSLEAAREELLRMGLTPEDIQGLMQEPKKKVVIENPNYDRENSGNTVEGTPEALSKYMVVSRENTLLRNADNVFAVRINGKDRYIFFNNANPRAKRMVESLKNMDVEQLHTVLRIIAPFTRYFSRINTQYNPVFGIYNFLRDYQGGAIQLSDTPIADQWKYVTWPPNVIGALSGIWQTIRAERGDQMQVMSPWAERWIEFQRGGGQTAYLNMIGSAEKRGTELQSELNRLSEGKGKKIALAAPRAILNFLEDFNDTLENAVRLVAYQAALNKGLSKERAISIAKNLTVNFNRKGAMTPEANALFSFFNSAAQGTTKLITTVSKTDRPGDITSLSLKKAGKVIIGGGLLLGVMQAVGMAMAGFGEDEPRDFVKDRNLIIPIGDGKYLAWPLPLGYHIIPATSRILTEWALSGGKDTGKRVTQLLGLYADAFNPLGNAGLSVQSVLPTIFDPFVALERNKDWTGKRIAIEDRNKLDPTPGYTRATQNATWISKQISEFLNSISGGDKDKPGSFSPTPDQIDYLAGQIGGGLYREISKGMKTAEATATGKELEPYNIPLIGRFYGDTKAGYAEASKFYKNVEELNILENQLQGRQRRGEPTDTFIKENPKARLIKGADQIEKNVRTLRKQRDDLIEKGAPQEQVKAKENLIKNQMKLLNDKVEALENPPKAKAAEPLTE